MSKNTHGQELLELFDIDIARIGGSMKASHYGQPIISPRLNLQTQPTFDDFIRTRDVAGAVPNWLTESYRAAYLAGKSHEERWNSAVAGKYLPADKAEGYKGAVARFIGDADKAKLKQSVMQATKALVVLEDRVALAATEPGADIDWTSARRQTMREMVADGTPPGIARMAAKLADGLKQTTPAKLRKLEAEKLKIVEKIYPDARIHTDHGGAWQQVTDACNDAGVSAPAPQKEQDLFTKLTPTQRISIESGEKVRGLVAMSYYAQARQIPGKAGVPSNAERAARQAVRKVFGKPYATLPTGWTHREMEQLLIKQGQQPIQAPGKTQSVELSVKKLETLDNYGLTPVHFAAAAGKLEELKAVLIANPNLLEVPAGTNGDPNNGQEKSRYENPTSKAVRYLGYAEKEGQRFMVPKDRTGITAGQMAVQFGHGQQLAACGYTKPVPPLTKDQQRNLGKDGREMLAEQYFPLPIIMAGIQAKENDMSIDQAMGETDLKFNKMLDSYSPAAGTNFPEYAASPIGLSVIDKVRADDERSRVAVMMAENMSELKNYIAQSISRPPDDRDLAHVFGCSETDIEKMEKSIRRVEFHSIDAPLENSEGEQRDSHGLIENEAQEEGFDIEFDESEAIREGMANLAPQLDEDERQVMVLQYGCECSTKDIAWMLGRSENNIYEIREVVDAKLWRELNPTLNVIGNRRQTTALATQERVKQAPIVNMQPSRKLQEVVQGD
jgi:RNA polymerase sigma factor (sigma-70 family)